MFRGIGQRLLPFLIWLIGFLLTIPSFLGIWFVLTSRDPRFNAISGVDVLHNCDQDISALVSLQPFAYEDVVLVTINIQDWSIIGESCQQIQYLFPELTYNHRYLMDVTSLMTSDTSTEEFTSPDFGRRWLPDASISYDSFSNQTVITVNPKELEGFVGSVEFIWPQGLRRAGFEKYNLFLPFRAANLGDSTLKPAKKFEITLSADEEKRLVSQMPEVVSLRTLANMNLYGFEIKPGILPLDLTFESSTLAQRKDIILIALSAAFGIGFTLLVEETISLLKSRKSSGNKIATLTEQTSEQPNQVPKVQNKQTGRKSGRKRKKAP